MERARALDEASLALLVDRFYDMVRADPALGPIFNGAVDDWPEHKRRLTTFWSSVALGTRSFRGNPMAVHRAQPGITRAHFTRWLQLWRQATADVFEAGPAGTLQAHAERIGESLQYGLGLRPGARDLGLPLRPD